MKKNLGNIVKLLVGLLISTMLVLYLTNSIDYKQVMIYIADIDWTYFIIGITCSLISHVSRGLRWSILLEDQGLKVDKKGLIAATYFSYFINILIPRGGELARCTSVSYKYGLPTDKLLGTIVLERVIDLVMLLLCITLVLFLDFNLFGSFFAERWTFLNEKFTSVVPILISLLVAGLVGLFVLYKMRNKFPIMTKIYEFIRGILDGLLSLKQLKRKGQFVFHTLFIWSMYLMMAFLPFKSFAATADYGIVKGLFVFILGGIGMTIPTPGGIGSYHAAVIEGMTQVLETSREVATAYAFSVHTLITVFTIAAGIVASIYLFKGKKHDVAKAN